jgi:hypothetical protein
MDQFDASDNVPPLVTAAQLQATVVLSIEMQEVVGLEELWE